MVVERLEIERAIDIEVAVTRDCIAQRGTVVEFRSTNPCIVGTVRGVAVYPVKDRQLVEW